jgi:hypothetical protein
VQQGVEQVGLRTSRVLGLGCELTAYSVSRCGPPNIGGVKSDRAIRADTALDEPGPQQAVHRLAHRLPALFQSAGDLGYGHAGLAYHRADQLHTGGKRDLSSLGGGDG